MKVLVFKDIKNNRWTLWSIDRKNHLGYLDSFILEHCELIVLEEKRSKILKTKKRFPHAWIVGILNTSIPSVSPKKSISYNPFKNKTFMCDNRPCFSSKRVFFSSEGKAFKA